MHKFQDPDVGTSFEGPPLSALQRQFPRAWGPPSAVGAAFPTLNAQLLHFAKSSEFIRLVKMVIPSSAQLVIMISGLEQAGKNS